jgi:hypothetical protein
LLFRDTEQAISALFCKHVPLAFQAVEILDLNACPLVEGLRSCKFSIWTK